MYDFKCLWSKFVTQCHKRKMAGKLKTVSLSTRFSMSKLLGKSVDIKSNILIP